MKEGRHHWATGSEPHWPGQTALQRAAKGTSELAPGTQPFHLHSAANPAPRALWSIVWFWARRGTQGFAYTKHVCYR